MPANRVDSLRRVGEFEVCVGDPLGILERRHIMRGRILCSMVFLAALGCVSLCTETSWATDWPQFQGNAQRTGYTADSVAPPYRARWIWCGPTHDAANHASNAAWPDDLTSRDGYNLPAALLGATSRWRSSPSRWWPAAGCSSATSRAPSTASTTTTAPTSGPARCRAARCAVRRGIRHDGGLRPRSPASSAAIDVAGSGTPSVDGKTGRSITAAPLVFNSMVYVADHGGIRAGDQPHHAAPWPGPRSSPAPVQGGIAAVGHQAVRRRPRT